MQIKIANNILRTSHSSDTNSFWEAMKEIEGQWIDVETDFLFENQYNVTTPSGKGLRIMQAQVTDVRNDIRAERKRCEYCGHHSALSVICCEHCGRPDQFKPYLCAKRDHVVKVNRNWEIAYSTQFGQITPYGYAELEIIHKPTGDIIRAQKWGSWSDIMLEKEVPQVVKNKLRWICARNGCRYKGYHKGIVERTWNI